MNLDLDVQNLNESVSRLVIELAYITDRWKDGKEPVTHDDGMAILKATHRLALATEDLRWSVLGRIVRRS